MNQTEVDGVDHDMEVVVMADMDEEDIRLHDMVDMDLAVMEDLQDGAEDITDTERINLMKIEMKKTIRNLTVRARIVKTQAPTVRTPTVKILTVRTRIARIRRRKDENSFKRVPLQLTRKTD